MMRKGDYKWHAVYVKSRTEKKSLSELTRRGIEAYLPLRVLKKQWSDRVKMVEEPLLTGYLFVRISYRESVEVLKPSGVMAFIAFGDEPAEIPEKQINDLKLFLEKVNSAVQVTNENLAKGQKVRIVGGPLAGVEGEISEIRGKKRIVLRFEKLGCSIFADVGTQLVEKVELLEA